MCQGKGNVACEVRSVFPCEKTDWKWMLSIWVESVSISFSEVMAIVPCLHDLTNSFLCNYFMFSAWYRFICLHSVFASNRAFWVNVCQRSPFRVFIATDIFLCCPALNQVRDYQTDGVFCRVWMLITVWMVCFELCGLRPCLWVIAVASQVWSDYAFITLEKYVCVGLCRGQ